MGTPPGQTGGVYHIWGTELAQFANAGAPDPTSFLPVLLSAVLLRAAGFFAPDRDLFAR